MVNYPRTIDEFGELTEAEQKFLTDTCAGEWCELGDRTRPNAHSNQRTIRAELIRYLALGGCETYPTHKKGIFLIGAFVTGLLDFELCKDVRRVGLFECYMPDGILARDAEVEGLYLNGSRIESGLLAERIKVRGDVALKNGFEAVGGVSLVEARIGGQIDCTNGKFVNEDLVALNAQAAAIKTDVFLRLGFEAKGQVTLSGIKIGGQLDCRGAKFENETGIAFTTHNATIKDTFAWLNVHLASGFLVFIRAHVGRIDDDAASWGSEGPIYLDGFTYDSLGGTMSVDDRLTWLGRNSRTDEDFQPQPYQQLAKVYGEMGHRRDRDSVLIEMETRLRDWQIPAMWKADPSPWGAVKVSFHWFFGHMARLMVGYGHRPALSLLWAVGIITLVSGFSWKTYHVGDFAPSAAQVLVSEDWQKRARLGGAENPAEEWTDKTAADRDYTTFNSVYYAADLFVPLVNFEQDADWAPSTTRSNWGRVAHYAEPWIRLFGWIITAMGAAAITGFIRND